MSQDISELLQQQVSIAFADATPVAIRGGGTKAFLGESVDGRPLDVAGHHGIVSYEPTELVITARTGTRIADIERLLADNGQMLAFEPPHFGDAATLGGTIACNLSGPRRPWSGAARDFVLGCRLVNGRGEVLSFGGEVMKNVAGYDVSRLMAGSLGTLGLLLEVSLKVLPAPEVEQSQVFECDAEAALAMMNGWATQPLPLSAACHDGAALCVRLSGTEASVRAAQRRIGGEALASDDDSWQRLREHRHGFFSGRGSLWRLSVPSMAPVQLPGDRCLHDWGGAQRWLQSDAGADRVRAAAAGVGGHAVLWRRGDADGKVPVFHPLSAAMMNLHRRLKAAFDPAGILNPGRQYRDL